MGFIVAALVDIAVPVVVIVIKYLFSSVYPPPVVLLPHVPVPSLIKEEEGPPFCFPSISRNTWITPALVSLVSLHLFVPMGLLAWSDVSDFYLAQLTDTGGVWPLIIFLAVC